MKGSTDSLSAGSVNLLKGNRILDFYNGIYCENVELQCCKIKVPNRFTLTCICVSGISAKDDAGDTHCSRNYCYTGDLGYVGMCFNSHVSVCGHVWPV